MGPEERAKLQVLVDDCVHCGFCLPACPTYKLWGEEMDSPRGRIHLVDQVLAGEPLDGTPTKHFDACLSCMACVTACPSGVRYGEVIEAVRAEVETRARRPWDERAVRAVIFSLFPYPRRLRLARLPLAFAEATGLRSLLRRTSAARLPPFLRAMESLAPAPSPLERLPPRVPAQGTCRGAVGLLTGCIQSVFFSRINSATARVLAAEGFDVVVPPGQGCCGALSWHAGREAQAARLAKQTAHVFKQSGVDVVVVNAAGCGSTVKEYSRLVSGGTSAAEEAAWLSSRARDLSEFLVASGTRAPRHAIKTRLAYQDACHLEHGQGIREQPRKLLSEVPGLEVLELADRSCCGSAGVYNLLQPGTAMDLGDLKAKAVTGTRAELVVSGNVGCLMQIRSALERAGSQVRTAHIAEVLDASIRGVAI